MKDQTITNNIVEYLWIYFDDERFYLKHSDRTRNENRTIILNLREALEVEKFIKLHREGKLNV